ncbi:SusC/RagA family TonB-linked outer membrane protein [Wocania ichthyoenteri]|uniref:SusC/RagA family TonB-linked outer membrane protein n=1 Tax=Wocania ichthyoenteri TaxID=1230531 RepID=UPI00068C560C|nr:SusC/RagA family TonB-linked outer membrane protein [Wocania ichthyoenteri]
MFEDDGITYSIDPFNPLYDNPLAAANERTDDFISDYFQSSVFGEYKILNNLKFKSVLGATVQNDFRGTYQSSKLVYGGSFNGIAAIDNGKRTSILTENYLTYSLNFNDRHELTILGGYSFQQFERLNSRARSSGFITDSSLYFNLGSGALAEPPSSSFEESKLISYFGRINYGYKNKYLLTATLRRDGSSVLAEGNKWDIFPSAALGWNIHKEGFLSDSNTINQMKFRLSYGVSGNNQSVQPYSSLARFRTVGAIYNGVRVNAVSPQSLSNRELEWERTAQTNIGFDLGLFHSKISLTADYYDMTTSKLLFSTPIPLYLGVGNSALKNIGETGNKGVEFSIGIKDIIKTIRWNTNFNISFNKNKVKKLPNGEDILYQSGRPGQFVGINNTQILTEGKPIGLFHGFVYDGVQQSGDELLTNAEGLGGEKFKDLNGDGVLDADDRMIIGDPNPDFHWGWNNSFSYKGIDLNIFIQGVQGNDILNYTRLWLEDGVGRRNASTALLNRWTPNNSDTDVPKASITRTQSLSSRWIEDGSYVRLKDITLGYTLPDMVTEKLKMSSLRIYISGQNLWTKTDYSGFDPEVGRGGAIEAIGVDFGSYPNTRNVTLGMNLSF